jgi:hypothetical protein
MTRISAEANVEKLEVVQAKDYLDSQVLAHARARDKTDGQNGRGLDAIKA